MTIEKQIEADFISAFKQKNVITKQLLGTIKGEMQTLKTFCVYMQYAGTKL